MAKSSIHIEAGKEGYLGHNDRSKKTVNSIFSDEKNEVWNSKKEGFELYRFWLGTRSEAYQKRTGQKLQKKAITHLSSIVNLHKNHTMNDLRKVADLLENMLDTRVFQIAIHRDEGHIENGKSIKNYHAHIEFLGLDSGGYSVRKKLTKKMLSTLQNEVAKTLQMERGINYAKEKKKRPKRLGTHEYKAHMRKISVERKTQKQLIEYAEMKTAEVEKAEKKEQGFMRYVGSQKAEFQEKITKLETEKNNEIATKTELKTEIKMLREMLRENGAKRPEHAQLEQAHRTLISEIEEKNLTISDMHRTISEMKKEIAEKNFTIWDIDRTIAKMKKEIEDGAEDAEKVIYLGRKARKYEELSESYLQSMKKAHGQVKIAENQAKMFQESAMALRQQLNRWEIEINAYEGKIEALSGQLKIKDSENQNLQNENEELRDVFLQLEWEKEQQQNMEETAEIEEESIDYFSGGLKP